MALEYVNNQTEAVCLEAVRTWGSALHYVKNQTYDLCLEAATKWSSAVDWIRDPTIKQRVREKLGIED